MLNYIFSLLTMQFNLHEIHTFGTIVFINSFQQAI